MNNSDTDTNKRSYQFTKRELDIYRNLWLLQPEEVEKLTRFFLLHTTAGSLLDAIDQSKNTYDCLLLEDISYRITYSSCTYEMLEDCPPDQIVQLSFRYKQAINLCYVLISICRNEQLAEAIKSKYKKFVPNGEQ